MGVAIYKQSTTYNDKVLVELAKVHYEGKELAASFEKGATKEEMLSKYSNKGAFKARLKQ